MGTDLHRGYFVLAAIVAVALMCLPTQASADSADYCVTCQNPSATYRCRVTGDGAKPSDALKLYCVIRTAKEGNHSSCKAQKATSDCVGLVKVYTYDGPALPENLTSDPRVLELQQKVERNQRDFQNPKGDEPSSLFELGGRAVDASKKRLRNAGAAIGIGESESVPHAAAPPPPPQTAQSAGESEGFAHRSYRCMRSLFRNCGSVDKEALE
jgi:hypothetical protein